jgi:hypothetical protein
VSLSRLFKASHHVGPELRSSTSMQRSLSPHALDWDLLRCPLDKYQLAHGAARCLLVLLPSRSVRSYLLTPTKMDDNCLITHWVLRRCLCSTAANGARCPADQQGAKKGLPKATPPPTGKDPTETLLARPRRCAKLCGEGCLHSPAA